MSYKILFTYIINFSNLHCKYQTASASKETPASHIIHYIPLTPWRLFNKGWGCWLHFSMHWGSFRITPPSNISPGRLYEGVLCRQLFAYSFFTLSLLLNKQTKVPNETNWFQQKMIVNKSFRASVWIIHAVFSQPPESPLKFAQRHLSPKGVSQSICRSMRFGGPKGTWSMCIKSARKINPWLSTLKMNIQAN